METLDFSIRRRFECRCVILVLAGNLDQRVQVLIAKFGTAVSLKIGETVYEKYVLINRSSDREGFLVWNGRYDGEAGKAVNSSK
jgi:hypothetical protein